MQDEDRLRPYVPGFLVEWLHDSPQVRHRRVEGTLAFVDVSGFTRLTERLAARGKAGAEEMSDLLDRTFGELLAVAYAHGAWLVKWGGDAVLLLFQDDGSDSPHAERACTAAVEMRRTMEAVGRLRTSCGPVRLRVSTGVHSGPVDLFLVGSSHHELVIAGPAATTTALTESAAAAGQVAVSAQTAALLPTGTVRARPDGVLLVVRSPGSPPRPPRRGAPVRGVDLGSCLPARTRRHLLSGGDDAEHRLISVAFVQFTGVDRLLADRGPGAAADAVEAVVRTCQEACLRYGVTFWETDISADGGKVMLVAGAPDSTGDEGDALLAVARAVVEAGGPLDVRVGVNDGRVFFGQFGPPYRRTMSIKGDAVNLAARLTARAEPGSVLASVSVVARARTPFEVQARTPFLVKGKSAPVHACTVGPPRAVLLPSAGGSFALHGRDDELAYLRTLWHAAGRGRLQVCDLVGEAGAGTSRLVHELAAGIHGAVDSTVVEVRCDPYTATTSYVPVRRVLRQLLGVADDAAPGDAGDVLLARLDASAPDLLPYAPLLAVVLGADVPATAATDALDERFRVPRQEEVTADLLVRLLPGRTLLVVDDAHLLDPSSAALLERLPGRAAAARWLVVRCRREEDPEPGPGRLVVPPLPREPALALLHALTSGTPLAPHEAELLVHRSGGNPLFLTELAAAVSHASGVEELPRSVEGVVAARIDRLGPDDRRLLRTAAVLGLDVDVDVLEQLGARTGSPVTAAALERLTPFLGRRGPRSYRFRQAVVQEVAYERLPYSRRSVLHGQLGDLLVERAAGRGDELAAVLSLHFSRAERPDQAWHYAQLAAGRAHAAMAHAEAGALYERALAAGRLLDSAVADLAPAWEGLGDVRYRLGAFAAAAAAYRQARRQRTDPLSSARLMHKAALCAERAGSYASALRWSSTARRLLESLPGEPAAHRLAAETLVVRATVRHWQGRHREAALECRRAVLLAEQAGALDVVADALVWLDVSELKLGQGAGEHAARALALLRRLGDQPWQTGRCLNELGIRAYFDGDWERARRCYEQCRASFEQAGDAWAASLASANEAEILVDQGRLAEAEPLLQGALRAAQASAAAGHTAFVLGLLGRREAAAGRHDEALGHLAAARALYQAAGEPDEVEETRVRTAEARLLAGDATGALAELADLSRRTATSSLVLRVRGLALLGQGRSEAAVEALGASLDAARAAGSEHEVVLALAALEQWHDRTGAATPSSAQAEARDLRAALGIVRLPVPRAAEPVVRQRQDPAVPALGRPRG